MPSFSKKQPCQNTGPQEFSHPHVQASSKVHGCDLQSSPLLPLPRKIMPLDHSIVHKISRNTDTSPIEISLAKTETGNEDSIVSLFEQLRKTYHRSSLKQVGQFDPERNDNPFPKLLSDLNEKKVSLLRLSQRLMEQLKHSVDSYHTPFEGHILFTLDTTVNHETLSLLWIEHQEAVHITQDLTLERVDYIDTKNLVAGITINLNDYQEAPEEKYLSLYVSRGQKEIGEYLESFCCFTTQVNTAAETEAFLNIVEQYTEQLPEEEGQLKRNDIIDYCIEQNMAGEPVQIEVLSTVLNERAPDEFSTFVSQHQETPKKAIHTHRPSLKRYGRYSGRDKDISLSFSASLVGEGIDFDVEENALIIRHIPKGLKEQLIKALTKKG